MTGPRDVDSGPEPIHPFPAWTRGHMQFSADQYYQAGVQRMEQAWEIYHCGNAYALAMYCGGLAVECLLRAFRWTKHPSFEGRHDLTELLRSSRLLRIDEDYLRRRGSSDDRVLEYALEI